MGTEQGTGELEMLKRHWGLLATAAIFAAGSASAQQVDIDTAKSPSGDFIKDCTAFVT
jgi:hypothetical protein